MPPIVVAGFSADRANHKVLSKSFTTLICGWRVQTKPGTYCASIVRGISSCRGMMPLVFMVAKDQFLAGEEMGAEIVIVHGRVEMADAQIVGIAFVRIGGSRGAEEVHLPIAREMGRRVDVALHEQRTRLWRAEKRNSAEVTGRNEVERDVRDKVAIRYRRR